MTRPLRTVRFIGGIFVCGLLLGSCSYFNGSEEIESLPGETSYSAALGDTPRGFITLSQLSPSERAELEERGHYLVGGPAACGFCHADPASSPVDGALSGGRIIRTPEGSFVAPNLTAHLESGVGRWGIEEIVHAVRDGIAPERRELNKTVHSGFEWLSDKDSRAIAAYILSLPPVDSKSSQNAEGPGLDLNSFQIAAPTFVTGKADDFRGYVPAIPAGQTFQYGQYLANHVARCQNCHNGEPHIFQSVEPYAGATSRGTGPGMWDEVKSVALGISTEENVVQYPAAGPDIRGSSEDGLASWQIEDIAHFLETGRTPKGEVVDSNLCPWEFYRDLTEVDRKAIAAFLKSL